MPGMDLLGAVRSLGRAGGRVGLDVLLPPVCMACDSPADGPFRLCAGCFGRCHFITTPFCRCCGVPFAYEGQGGPDGRCAACREQRRAFHTARGALAYDEHSRALLLQFKHADRTELARLFAPMLLRAGGAALQEADWLVPIPLHTSRLRQRGYNQAALLARALSRSTGVAALADGLERIRKTPSLGELDAAARRRMMAGAVRVRGHRAGQIAGRRIMLIDDVMTSGATSDVCAQALVAAGARQVDVLVVARVPEPDS